MGRTYIVEERDNTAGCLTALILTVIIIGVLLYLFAYALLIALFVILGISAIVGGVFTLRNHVLGLRDAISMHRYDSKPSWWILPEFFWRWAVIVLETVRQSWIYTYNCVKDFLSKVGYYRLLSFRKWMYLFVGISVFVFGLMLTVVLAWLQIQLILMVIMAIVGVILLVSVAFALAGLGLALAFSAVNYVRQLRDAYFGRGTDFAGYIKSYGFRDYLGVIAAYFMENMDHMKDHFSEFSYRPMLSPMKWVHLWAGILLAGVGTLLIAVYGLLHILALALMFPVCLIISLIRGY